MASDSSEWFVWLALFTKEVLDVTITHISQIGGVMMIQHDLDSDSDSIRWRRDSQCRKELAESLVPSRFQSHANH